MGLKSNDNIAVRYHDIFDYKLTKDEAVKWQYKSQKILVSGRKNKSRLQREKYSCKKLELVKNAANLISRVSTVLFVGITGSLSMMNSEKDSDIDLIIITKTNTLWITRLLVYIELRIMNYELRNPNNKNEKDKLCLNMWLDETSLVWDRKDRNIYTAHEIAQIVPLINRENIYENFLQSNRWILNYWPNSVEQKYLGRSISYIGKTKTQYTIYNIPYTFFEEIAFKLQYLYMKNKITTEIITSNKAIFHKKNWAKVIIDKLGS